MSRRAFGKRYDPQGPFTHGVWVQIAVYEPTNGDGARVVVSEVCYPASFYKLVVQSQGLVLKTGSSQGELAAAMADAFSQGLLDASNLDDA